MMKNWASERYKKKRTILGFVLAGIFIFAIILIIVLIPKKKKDTSSVILDRIECPGFKDMKDCTSKGCAFQEIKGRPSCYMKKESFGYKLMSEVDQYEFHHVVKLNSRSANIPYGPSLSNVRLEVTYLTANMLRVTLRDEKERYEVPVQTNFPLFQDQEWISHRKIEDNLAYNVTYSNDAGIFTFKINRPNGSVLWDTSIGGLVLSDQFLQIASYLPSKNVYGLGEHVHDNLRHDVNYRTWPIFARDIQPAGEGINLYGSWPYYTCLEKDGKSHGVLLLNSNAMEVTLMPAPAISFRTIGGILDLFFFVGDSPEHVAQLYTSLVGRPVMPPYWGLGFQLSRYGYKNLSNVKKVIERTRAAGIAQDVQILDIDHMDHNKDFTYNENDFPGLPAYMKETQEEYGLKWIIILDPAIAASKGYATYESGLGKDVYIKRSPKWKKDMFPSEVRDNDVLFGKVWPDEVVAFPDFFQNKTQKWWIKTIADYHKTLPFDGLWIDMNEPANFGTNEERPFYCQPHNPNEQCWSLKCPPSTLEDPPYNPLKKSGTQRLSQMTLCMESLQSIGNKSFLHYDVHTLYGWSQTVPTLEAAQEATGTRSIVISRSTYPSSGRYTGHWLGDNKSTWDDLRRSIIGMLEFNMFGIPYIGADICGFFEDTTEELCKRWMQLGSFYPFFRNHNRMNQKDQDPAIFGGEMTAASLRAVERRYQLQPYLYTLFYQSHVYGSTVVRPLFHEFPMEEETWNNGQQFLWGPCVLVSPILEKGKSFVKMYLPKDEWWHFDFNKSSVIEKEKVAGGYIVKKGVSFLIPLHVRGSCIIPIETYELKSREKKSREISIYGFVKKGRAAGQLFIDDGISKDTIEKKNYQLYDFSYSNCTLDVSKNTDSVYSGEVPFLKQITLVYKIEGGTGMYTKYLRQRLHEFNKASFIDNKGECHIPES